jgi:hypothetical protein
MPSLAAYQVIDAGSVTLGPFLPEAEGQVDHEVTFNLPDDVNIESPAILAFRVNPYGTQPVALEVQINAAVILNQTFDTAPQRSWHEIFSARVMMAGDINELVMWTPHVGENDPGGKITVSNIVVFFETTNP